ncbi:transmembrane protein 198-like isoform X3 [Stylophora pistillata]|uniref:Transmembrane protein 198 n=2 Tax=Stylophora pistillata TaxID=50429 RepID=A0A2B4STQ6_STYPI|nr:transmembrane protein 198-like isoform X3 [Stylophora pistillata]PFX33281.1 Transmembrane protein 198 [Stylophora pistillata]
MMGRPQRVSEPILRAILLAFYWISSTTAMENNRTSNDTNNSSNGETDKPFSCEWKDLEFPITYGPGIASSLCIVIGGFHLILGFKYQRITLFATGFSSAALLSYAICLIRSTLAIYYILLIVAAVAIFAGILCTTVVFCGLFSSGIVAGFCLAMAFLLGFASLYQYTTLSLPVGVIILGSVLIAGASVWWKRVLLVVTSSIYGGALVTGGLDYFIEDLRLLDYFWLKIFLKNIKGHEPCMFSWIILGVWPLLILIGLLVQFLKTAKQPPKPKKDFHNKRYTMGSPYYSAPDDVEMTELLAEQAQAPPTPSHYTDHTHQRAPMLLGED